MAPVLLRVKRSDISETVTRVFLMYGFDLSQMVLKRCL